MEDEKNSRDFYYCNVASIEVSNYDFRFYFGRVKNNKPSDVNVGINMEKNIEAEVTMSPQHAKALLTMLNMNVAKYEELFGEINIIPNIPKGNIGGQ